MGSTGGEGESSTTEESHTPSTLLLSWMFPTAKRRAGGVEGVLSTMKPRAELTETVDQLLGTPQRHHKLITVLEASVHPHLLVLEGRRDIPGIDTPI
jgi:hypothetical protein